MDQWSIWRN